MTFLRSWEYPLDRSEKMWRLLSLCQHELELGPCCENRHSPQQLALSCSCVAGSSAWEFPLSNDEKMWRLLRLFATEAQSVSEMASDVSGQESPSVAGLCRDVAWEVTVTRVGAWDFPLSRHEQLLRTLLGFDRAGSWAPELPHNASPKSFGSWGMPSFDSPCSGGRSWDVPLSQAEKVSRLLRSAADAASAAAVPADAVIAVSAETTRHDDLRSTSDKFREDSTPTHLVLKPKRRQLSCKGVCVSVGWLAVIALSVSSARHGRRMEVCFSWG